MLRLQLVEDLLPPGKAKEQLEQSLQRADQAIAEDGARSRNFASPQWLAMTWPRRYAWLPVN